MTPEEAKQLPKHLPSPVLDGLPAYLKDPANYDKVQRALIETLASKHSHADISAWANCGSCQKKAVAHTEMMKKLGFKSGAQYKAWQKIHHVIKNRDPLVQWKV